MENRESEKRVGYGIRDGESMCRIGWYVVYVYDGLSELEL